MTCTMWTCTWRAVGQTDGPKIEALRQNAKIYIRNFVTRVHKRTPRNNKPASIFIYSLVDGYMIDMIVEESKHFGACGTLSSKRSSCCFMILPLFLMPLLVYIRLFIVINKLVRTSLCWWDFFFIGDMTYLSSLNFISPLS